MMNDQKAKERKRAFDAQLAPSASWEEFKRTWPGRHREMIEICKTALDFDAPMIACLKIEADIGREEAEKFCAANIDEIFTK